MSDFPEHVADLEDAGGDSGDEIPQFADSDELDYPLRVIIVVNSTENPAGEMEERLLDTVRTMGDMNGFFDEFDEKVAIPNKDHIKYEVGSDGLVVIIVDNAELQESALKFMDEYRADLHLRPTDSEEEPPVKRKA